MNPESLPIPPQLPAHNPAREMHGSVFMTWLKRLLVCNPFYLASAALLLFGLSRLTRDSSIITNETREVLFQFGILQTYGFLLVGTSLWLARRRIWYDSALLVVLENGLLLAPFLGISQAVLLDETLAISLALGGGLAVIGRAWSIRRGYPSLNLPDRARIAGALILALNVGLPLVYRTRVDTDWHLGNRILWLAVLPSLAFLPIMLPKPSARSRGTEATPAEVSWLPMLVYGLWLAGTAVHAWSIAWVDKTPTPNVLLLPVVIASLWTMQWRHEDFAAGDNAGPRATLLLATAVAGWTAAELLDVAVAVAVVNTFLFVVFALRQGSRLPLLRWIAWSAATVSAFRVLFLLRPDWVLLLLNPKPYLIATGVAVGVGFVTMLMRVRTPVAGVMGSIGTCLAVCWWNDWQTAHLGFQVGALLGLAHSLRWQNCSESDALLGRAAIGLAWTIDSLVWAWEPQVAMGWMPCAFGGGALIALLALRKAMNWPVPYQLFGLAGVNFLVPPGVWTAHNLSSGVLTLLLSLACFGIGTAFALRRQDSRS